MGSLFCVRSSRNSCMRISAAALAGAIGFAGMAHWSRAEDETDKKVNFTADIAPIFKQSCVKCHSLNNPRKQAAANFRLDDRAAAIKGGKIGHDIVPGKSADSLLYKLIQGPVKVHGKNVDPMPKAKRGETFKPLPDEQIALIKRWIDQGAK
ncbi:MAG TPA: c-type cytochrome domain-containing protein [Tepidisphaeraceae bacterium]|nr:c-type cytochrome domain-containing protein [Tepidisphaeraceae bacterium]